MVIDLVLSHMEDEIGRLRCGVVLWRNDANIPIFLHTPSLGHKPATFLLAVPRGSCHACDIFRINQSPEFAGVLSASIFCVSDSNIVSLFFGLLKRELGTISLIAWNDSTSRVLRKPQLKLYLLFSKHRNVLLVSLPRRSFLMLQLAVVFIGVHPKRFITCGLAHRASSPLQLARSHAPQPLHVAHHSSIALHSIERTIKWESDDLRIEIFSTSTTLSTKIRSRLSLVFRDLILFLSYL